MVTLVTGLIDPESLALPGQTSQANLDPNIQQIPVPHVRWESDSQGLVFF